MSEFIEGHGGLSEDSVCMYRKPEWTFRLAVPTDAPAFAQWATENPLIDREDVQAGLSQNNPTAVVFVAELDGVPMAFAPFYCQMALAHLGFNPESRGTEKLKALQVMLDGVAMFSYQMGIRELVTLSKKDYPVAKWAESKGFEPDSREQFKLNLKTYLKIEETCAPVTSK